MKVFVRRVIDLLFNGVRAQDVRANITLSNPEGKLKDKTIVITGGSRGIGFNIAKKCVEEGANVVITGRNEEVLKKAAMSLKNCMYVVYDVNDFEKIADFFDECEIKFGRSVDCLVNNAGISLHEGSIENVSFESYNSQFNTNLKAPYFLSKEFVLRYIKNKKQSGSILFVSSERGLYCDDQPYGMIKAGINSLTLALGRRYINIGLRVNGIAPGVTVSDLTKFTEDGNLYRPQSCGNRVYLGQEVAEIAVFLLSDISSCISSQIIPCNRGNHLKCDW